MARVRLADVPLEKTVKKNVKEYLRKRGAYVIVSHDRTGRGVADLSVCYLGHWLSMEIKRAHPDSKPSPAQERRIELVRRAGGLAQVVRSVEDAAGMLAMVDSLYGAASSLYGANHTKGKT